MKKDEGLVSWWRVPVIFGGCYACFVAQDEEKWLKWMAYSARFTSVVERGCTWWDTIWSCISIPGIPENAHPVTTHAKEQRPELNI